MTRAQPPIEIEPRSEARFTTREKREILERQSDETGLVRCYDCDLPIAQLLDRGWENLRRHDFDHDRARELGGKTEIANGRARCAGPGSCHARKTKSDNSAANWAKKRSGEFKTQRVRRATDGPSLKGNSSFRRWS